MKDTTVFTRQQASVLDFLAQLISRSNVTDVAARATADWNINIVVVDVVDVVVTLFVEEVEGERREEDLVLMMQEELRPQTSAGWIGGESRCCLTSPTRRRMELILTTPCYPYHQTTRCMALHFQGERSN